MKIAIMQPYFVPYLGYFRLMHAADHFVIYDCVQFQRRGYIHRNMLRTRSQNIDWLTLPINKVPQTTKINRITFRKDSKDIFLGRLKRFEIYERILRTPELKHLLLSFEQSPTQYISKLLYFFTRSLNINCRFMFSSELNIPEKYSGQNRILEIAKRLNATHYINAPNGKNLYCFETFDKSNIKLQFLRPFQEKGYLGMLSILEYFCQKNVERKDDLENAVKSQTNFQNIDEFAAGSEYPLRKALV